MRPGADPGDYPGDPLDTVASQSIWWANSARTKLGANWSKAGLVDDDAHWIIYQDGVIVGRITVEAFQFTVELGVIPNLAAIAVPADLDDGVYDPLFSDDTAVNLFSLRAAPATRPRMKLNPGYHIACSSDYRMEVMAGDYEMAVSSGFKMKLNPGFEMTIED